jgi:CheY-like chemotaxis protein
VVESIPGKGTKFEIFLKQTDIESNSKKSIHPEIEGGSERILLVDDEEMMVTVMTELLRSLGYRVSSFKKVTEALSNFIADPDAYDLVITDHTMPKMTGLELTQQLLDIRKDIPIILCTGYNKAVNEDNVSAAGIKGLLMKPIRKRELASMIRSALASGE